MLGPVLWHYTVINSFLSIFPKAWPLRAPSPPARWISKPTPRLPLRRTPSMMRALQKLTMPFQYNRWTLSAYVLVSILQCRHWALSDTLTGTNKRSEEHTSELQSRGHLVCRLLLE